MEINDKDKALKVIERLVSDDFCQELEFNIAMKRPVVLSKADIYFLNKKLTIIYEFAHAVREDASCYLAHESWRKELAEMYDTMVKDGVL